MNHVTHISAPPGGLHWRPEICPHAGAKVLLRTVGGTCVVGSWYGLLGFAFTAWCPLPKDGEPPEHIQAAPFLQRVKFAFKLIFQPAELPQ
jgi:hypothetical protein